MNVSINFCTKRMLPAVLAPFLLVGSLSLPAQALPFMGADKDNEADDTGSVPPPRKLSKTEEQQEAELYKRGQMYVQQNNFDLSKVCFQQCININPNNSNAHLGLGISMAASNQADLDPALMEIFEALRCNTSNAEARLWLGQLLMKQQKWDEAGGQFLQVLNLQPENLVARANLASCCMQLGQLDGAMVQYKYILEKEPKAFEVQNNLGAAYELKCDYDSGAEQYKKIIEYQPKYAMAYLGLARCLLAKKDYKSALVLIKHVIDQLEPGNAMAYFTMGKVYEAMDQRRLAIDAYSHSLKLNPKENASEDALRKIFDNGGIRDLRPNTRVAGPKGPGSM